MNPILVFFIFLTVRVISVFIVQTWYVPDEYWQSLEVAHKLVFGYGHLTWEWQKGIRSYIHPILIAGLYKILELLKYDSVEFVVILPKILQSLISAYSDYRLYIWTGKKKWSIFLTTISYFWFYTGSRTLANTLETSLTTIALSYFPWNSESTTYLWITGLCCFIRPTAAITWLPLCLHHLSTSKYSISELFLKRYLVIGLVIAGICTAIDSLIYGRFIITPYEFLKYNVFHGIGSFYGTHPWHWYFTSGLPTILGITTLPFFGGIIQTIRYPDIYSTRKCLLISILFTLIILSCLPHKEFRFVLILLPMCLYICTDFLARYSHKASRLILWFVAAVLLVGNIIPTWYLSMIHQKGTITVMPELAKIANDYYDDYHKIPPNFMFLMPCHSTPYYSHIHKNITMRFLTCEPNFDDKINYIDEADEFYKNPEYWLKTHLPYHPWEALPTHLIMFDTLIKKIPMFLQGYTSIYETDHAEFSTPRTGRKVVIYKRLFNRNEQTVRLSNNKDEFGSASAPDLI